MRLFAPGPADGPHLAAAAAATEELIAIGLEPGHTDAARHLDPLQHLSCLGIDTPQIALLAFPGAVPELAVGPGDAGHDTIGFDGAQDLPGLGIDLNDLAAAVLADPQRPFGPGEA